MSWLNKSNRIFLNSKNCRILCSVARSILSFGYLSSVLWRSKSCPGLMRATGYFWIQRILGFSVHVAQSVLSFGHLSSAFWNPDPYFSLIVAVGYFWIQKLCRVLCPLNDRYFKTQNVFCFVRYLKIALCNPVNIVGSTGSYKVFRSFVHNHLICLGLQHSRSSSLVVIFVTHECCPSQIQIIY